MLIRTWDSLIERFRSELRVWVRLPDADTRRYYLVIRPTAGPGAPGDLRVMPYVPDGWQAVAPIRRDLTIEDNIRRLSALGVLSRLPVLDTSAAGQLAWEAAR